MHAVSGEIAAQWQTNSRFPEGSIGRMMVPPRAVFRPDISVRDTVEQLRPLVRTAFITRSTIRPSSPEKNSTCRATFSIRRSAASSRAASWPSA